MRDDGRPFTINDEFAPIFEARAAELAQREAERQAAAEQRAQVTAAGVAALGALLDQSPPPTDPDPAPAASDEPVTDDFLAQMIKENNR